MVPERCIILIDGSNFYFKLKDLGLHQLLTFDFVRFTKLLSIQRHVVQVIYYIGAVKTDGTEQVQRMFNQQRKLLAHLRKQGVTYSLGYLMKTDGALQEKGVDVNIAVDMLVAAYENRCDRIILVSSDTDLIPAIKKAQQKGKIVEYIGFAHKRSMALLAMCKDAQLLKREDIAPLLMS